MPSLGSLKARERKLVESKDIARIATVSPSGWPHCVPVSYLFDAGIFYVPVGEKSVKARNLALSRKATLVIDDEEEESGVMLECSASLLGRRLAAGWKRYMRQNKHWDNDSSTLVVRLEPVRKTSWFLKGRRGA